MPDFSKLPQLSGKARVLIPNSGDKVEDFVDRWSSTNVSLPAAVIAPDTEEDIEKVVAFTKNAGLTLLPFAGGHERSIPINDETLVLDLRQFSTISLAENRDSVTFGGGVITRDLLHALSEAGLYANVPNSNAVGMVGFTTTAGSSVFTSLKGLAFDHILALRVVTASGETLELSTNSQGEEARLFDAFCGAGWGLGIVISMTIRAWPMEDLRLEEDKVWVRSLIFIPPAIEAAAKLFTKLQVVEDPRLSTTLMFLTAPPNSPHPGAPMILVSCKYFGTTELARRAAAATYDQDVVARATSAPTSLVPLAQINAMAEGANRHGGFKEGFDLYCSDVRLSSIMEAFGCWQRLVGDVPGSSSSYFVLNARSPRAAASNDPKKTKHARAMRENSTFVQLICWVEAESAIAAGTKCGEELMEAFDPGKELRLKQNVESESKMEAKRVKNRWDSSGLFWSPL